MRTLTLSCALLLAGACADAPGPPPFVAAADSKQLMLSVLEPAAEVYWDAVGIIMDLEGEYRIEPRTAEEWEAAENAAWVLAESGNLLLLQERVQGDHWVAMSRAMIDIGMRAVEAAQARDPDRVFEVGGDVYLVCTGCHAVYATQTLRPNYDTLPDPAAGEASPAGRPDGSTPGHP
ncbi:MAG: hypothetical protein F4087_11120 [Gemmatimonadetes bacterium]|nr:hypothetical protein [Gemmatimonadota bacterium]MYA11780.1 hypothetical protein [Gemmatimonadota bacterium]MYD13069.1 hypothetical protein [Gemmatimonadota bacterium]MYE70392.1 hypothetical protein [Gemmatimonadota bacterium]MYI65052.1 hypothetical protein [Gemmatimonadota bacterium]